MHKGVRLRVRGIEAVITDFDSPTVVSATLTGNLPDSSSTPDWSEAAFSPARGYPVSVAFHQDRLVIGGSRDLPNRLWLSKSGDLFNFDTGTGLDDEAIEFSILSDQVDAIRNMFSGRHLQVFTSGAEWMVTGSPLTPSSVQITRQTRVGSLIGRNVPPVNIDGATLFAARGGREIREFLYTDIEQAYQASDLSVISRHIIRNPVDQDYDSGRRLLFLVREDGKIATLTVFRSEQVSAWTLHDTEGTVESVAVVGEDVYVLVARNGTHRIEVFDDDLNLDSALTGDSEIPSALWSGLDHLEGQNISILADGAVQASHIVRDGQIHLDFAARTIEAGLPYTHIIEPLPPSESTGAGGGRAVRLIRAIFRLEDSAALRLDTGQGLRDIPVKRKIGADPILAPPQRLSGTVCVRAYGWHTRNESPLWRIEQSAPLPFTLLSVTTEMKVNE